MVVGIDPGTWCLGFGVVGRIGGGLRLVDHGAFRAGAGLSIAERLRHMHACVCRLLDHHRPDVLALEQAFLQKNVQSALRLGEVRGTILLAAAARELPVVEYPTAVAKKSVTGHGGASKEEVRFMVMEELALETPPEPLDATDALALALCLLHDPALDPRFHQA